MLNADRVILTTLRSSGWLCSFLSRKFESDKADLMITSFVSPFIVPVQIGY